MYVAIFDIILICLGDGWMDGWMQCMAFAFLFPESIDGMAQYNII